MARVSTVQFNGSNAYELSQGDVVTSFTFGTKNYQNIAFAVQVYAFSTGATLRAKVKCLDAQGKVLSYLSKEFTPTNMNMWERFEATWAYPETSEKAEIQLESVAGTLLIAQPKAISGTIAGAYSTNFAPQLTLLTPTGIYTGTVTANQIIVTGAERLDKRLTTINNSLISLQDVDKGLRADLTAQALQFTDLSNETKSLKASYTAQGVKISSLETNFGSRLTNVEAGKITLSSNTGGVLAGLQLTSSTLRATNGSYGIQISGNPNYLPIFVGNSSFSSSKFSVTWGGKLTAIDAEIKGTLRAGSIINGSLNNTTGSHSGSLNNATGSYQGSLNYTSGYHSGNLYQAGGSFYGSPYCSYGSLGGVGFKPGANKSLFFDSSVTVKHGLISNTGIRVFGSIYYYGDLIKESDQKVKQNIEDIPQAYVDDLMNVKIKRFEYKKNPGQKELGVIAQDVVRDTSRSFSDIFVKPQDGVLTVSYVDFIPVIIKTIQQQEAKIKELERKLENA